MNCLYVCMIAPCNFEHGETQNYTLGQNKTIYSLVWISEAVILLYFGDPWLPFLIQERKFILDTPKANMKSKKNKEKIYINKL